MPPIINDEGVSEIIAVSLIVILTVLIATIAASYSYGLGQKMSQQKFIALTVERIDSTTISVENSGGDVQELDTSVLCPFIVMVDGTTVGASSGNLDENIGSLSQYNANMGAHVVVVGLCNDGTSQVFYDDTL